MTKLVAFNLIAMRNYISILFLLLGGISFAQDQFEGMSIEYGPLFKAQKRSVPTDFIGFDDSGFYVEYSKGKHGQGDLILAKFDQDLNPILEKDMNFMLGNQLAEVASFFRIDKSLYQLAITSSMESKEYYLQQIDTESFKTFSPKKIASLESKKINVNRSSSWLAFSNDSSKLSLSYTYPTGRNEEQKINAHVLDKDFNELWSNSFDLPYKDKLIDIKTLRVNDTGDLHILTKRFYEKRRERVGGEVNYDYLILTLKSDGSLDSLTIEADGKYLRDVQFGLSDDLIIAGFYSDLNSALVGGAFYTRYNMDQKAVISQSFKEFDIDFLVTNMKEKKADRIKKKIEDGKDVELPSYKIDEFYYDNEGNTLMIGEKRLITVNYVYTQYGTTSYTTYDYGDIVTVKIDKAGEISWANRVAKNQVTINDGALLSSYGALVTDDKTVLLFNDNEENASYNGVGKVKQMYKGSNNMLMMAKVDNTGNVTRQGLFKQSEADVRVRPAFSVQTGENEILVFGHKGLKHQRFIRFIFD